MNGRGNGRKRKNTPTRRVIKQSGSTDTRRRTSRTRSSSKRTLSSASASDSIITESKVDDEAKSPETAVASHPRIKRTRGSWIRYIDSIGQEVGDVNVISICMQMTAVCTNPGIKALAASMDECLTYCRSMFQLMASTRVLCNIPSPFDGNFIIMDQPMVVMLHLMSKPLHAHVRGRAGQIALLHRMKATKDAVVEMNMEAVLNRHPLEIMVSGRSKANPFWTSMPQILAAMCRRGKYVVCHSAGWDSKLPELAPWSKRNTLVQAVRVLCDASVALSMALSDWIRRKQMSSATVSEPVTESVESDTVTSAAAADSETKETESENTEAMYPFNSDDSAAQWVHTQWSAIEIAAMKSADTDLFTVPWWISVYLSAAAVTVAQVRRMERLKKSGGTSEPRTRYVAALLLGDSKQAIDLWKAIFMLTVHSMALWGMKISMPVDSHKPEKSVDVSHMITEQADLYRVLFAILCGFDKTMVEIVSFGDRASWMHAVCEPDWLVDGRWAFMQRVNGLTSSGASMKAIDLLFEDNAKMLRTALQTKRVTLMGSTIIQKSTKYATDLLPLCEFASNVSCGSFDPSAFEGWERWKPDTHTGLQSRLKDAGFPWKNESEYLAAVSAESQTEFNYTRWMWDKVLPQHRNNTLSETVMQIHNGIVLFLDKIGIRRKSKPATQAQSGAELTTTIDRSDSASSGVSGSQESDDEMTQSLSVPRSSPAEVSNTVSDSSNWMIALVADLPQTNAASVSAESHFDSVASSHQSSTRSVRRRLDLSGTFASSTHSDTGDSSLLSGITTNQSETALTDDFAGLEAFAAEDTTEDRGVFSFMSQVESPTVTAVSSIAAVSPVRSALSATVADESTSVSVLASAHPASGSRRVRRSLRLAGSKPRMYVDSASVGSAASTVSRSQSEESRVSEGSDLIDPLGDIMFHRWAECPHALKAVKTSMAKSEWLAIMRKWIRGIRGEPDDWWKQIWIGYAWLVQKFNGAQERADIWDTITQTAELINGGVPTGLEVVWGECDLGLRFCIDESAPFRGLIDLDTKKISEERTVIKRASQLVLITMRDHIPNDDVRFFLMRRGREAVGWPCETNASDRAIIEWIGSHNAELSLGVRFANSLILRALLRRSISHMMTVIASAIAWSCKEELTSYRDRNYDVTQMLRDWDELSVDDTLQFLSKRRSCGDKRPLKPIVDESIYKPKFRRMLYKMGDEIEESMHVFVERWGHRSVIADKLWFEGCVLLAQFCILCENIEMMQASTQPTKPGCIDYKTVLSKHWDPDHTPRSKWATPQRLCKFLDLCAALSHCPGTLFSSLLKIQCVHHGYSVAQSQPIWKKTNVVSEGKTATLAHTLDALAKDQFCLKPTVIPTQCFDLIPPVVMNLRSSVVGLLIVYAGKHHHEVKTVRASVMEDLKDLIDEDILLKLFNGDDSRTFPTRGAIIKCQTDTHKKTLISHATMQSLKANKALVSVPTALGDSSVEILENYGSMIYEIVPGLCFRVKHPKKQSRICAVKVLVSNLWRGYDSTLYTWMTAAEMLIVNNTENYEMLWKSVRRGGFLDNSHKIRHQVRLPSAGVWNALTVREDWDGNVFDCIGYLRDLVAATEIDCVKDMAAVLAACVASALGTASLKIESLNARMMWSELMKRLCLGRDSLNRARAVGICLHRMRVPLTDWASISAKLAMCKTRLLLQTALKNGFQLTLKDPEGHFDRKEVAQWMMQTAGRISEFLCFTVLEKPDNLVGGGVMGSRATMYRKLCLELDKAQCHGDNHSRMTVTEAKSGGYRMSINVPKEGNILSMSAHPQPLDECEILGCPLTAASVIPLSALWYNSVGIRVWTTPTHGLLDAWNSVSRTGSDSKRIKDFATQKELQGLAKWFTKNKSRAQHGPNTGLVLPHWHREKMTKWQNISEEVGMANVCWVGHKPEFKGVQLTFKLRTSSGAVHIGYGDHTHDERPERGLPARMMSSHRKLFEYTEQPPTTPESDDVDIDMPTDDDSSESMGMMGSDYGNDVGRREENNSDDDWDTDDPTGGWS